MGLFDGFLELFLRLTDPTPEFSPERCLLERGAVGGCSACAEVCPKEAVDLSGQTVRIDEAACTGCGLCAGACPGIALEFPLAPVQEAFLRGRGVVRCSRAEGEGGEVYCLGRLTPGVLAWAASRLNELTLVHGQCASCQIGGEGVPKRVEEMIAEARRYYPETRATLTTEPPAKPVSLPRRELFKSLFSTTRRLAAEALPDLPEEIAPPEELEVPIELKLRRLAAERASEVRWPGVAVEEGCTLCPVCENVCPTGAIRREARGEERALLLELELCTGCSACITSCPVGVMRPQDYGKEELMASPLLLFSAPSS